MLVDPPCSERDDPVVAAGPPRALVVVVEPADFAEGTGVGLASGLIVGTTGALAAAAGAAATGSNTGAAVGACSVGTFGATIAELAAGPDVAGAKLAATSFDCSSSGRERSMSEKASEAGCAGRTWATGTAGAPDAAAADAGVTGA